MAASVASERKILPGLRSGPDGRGRQAGTVRGVPRVMGFIGTSDRQRRSATKKSIRRNHEPPATGWRPAAAETLFEQGEMVRVNDGPFANFNSVVEEVDYESLA